MSYIWTCLICLIGFIYLYDLKEYHRDVVELFSVFHIIKYKMRISPNTSDVNFSYLKCSEFSLR